MGEDRTTERVIKNRIALGDLTNQPPKRNFTSIQGGLGVKSGDGNSSCVDSEDGESEFSKRVCLRVDELLREKNGKKSGMDDGKKRLPSFKTKPEKIVSVVSKMSKDINKTANAIEGTCDPGDNLAEKLSTPRAGDPSKETVLPCDSEPASAQRGDKDCNIVGEKCQEDEGRIDSAVARSDAVAECLGAHDGRDAVEGNGSGLRKYGSAECSKLPTLQGSISFELERCTVHREGCAKASAGGDPLKECSCSFCLKAGHIWLDLQCQDRKGRLAALKKSQKEASILVNKSCRGKVAETHDIRNSSKSSKLESDLSSQWRSLFLHMEDTFLREGSQIQASLAALEDLRVKCKTDLERMNGKPSNKQ